MGLMSAITGNATEVSESKIQETIGPLLVEGETAGKVLISEKYILGMESISKNPSDKMFVPNNFSPLFNFDLGDKK